MVSIGCAVTAVAAEPAPTTALSAFGSTDAEAAGADGATTYTWNVVNGYIAIAATGSATMNTVAGE